MNFRLKRNLTRETQLLPGDRVNKTQKRGVQQKAIRFFPDTLGSIEFVAEYRMPQCLQMHPQLVGTASLRGQIQTCRVSPGVMVDDPEACS